MPRVNIGDNVGESLLRFLGGEDGLRDFLGLGLHGRQIACVDVLLQGGVIDFAIIPGDFGDVVRRRLDLLVLLLPFGPRIAASCSGVRASWRNAAFSAIVSSFGFGLSISSIAAELLRIK